MEVTKNGCMVNLKNQNFGLDRESIQGFSLIVVVTDNNTKINRNNDTG